MNSKVVSQCEELKKNGTIKKKLKSVSNQKKIFFQIISKIAYAYTIRPWLNIINFTKEHLN